MFRTPLFAVPAVPFCTGKPLTLSVPLLAINAPPLETSVETVPKPMTVPAAALVRLPPTRKPPLRLTEPLFIQAGTTLSVPAAATLIEPFWTGAVVNSSVPLVAVIAPELTRRLESVPKPCTTDPTLLVRLLPTMNPPASWTVPLLAQLVLALTVWLETFSVPLISGATLLMINPPVPPSESVPVLARVKPPTTLARAPVTVVEPEMMKRLVAALFKMIWLIVALPARVPALVALMLVANSVPVRPSGPLMLRKLLPRPLVKIIEPPCAVPASVSVPTPVTPLEPAIVSVLKVTLLENCRLRLPDPPVAPPKLIWPTPLVKNAMPLRVTETLLPLPVLALVRLKLSATKVSVGALVMVWVLLLLLPVHTMDTFEPFAGKPPFQLAELLRSNVPLLLNVPWFHVTEPARSEFAHTNAAAASAPASLTVGRRNVPAICLSLLNTQKLRSL